MSYVDQPTSPGAMSARRLTNRNTNRYSVTALFSMAAEQDVEVEDDLARGMIWVPVLLLLTSLNGVYSTKAATRSQGQDFCAIQEELCA